MKEKKLHKDQEKYWEKNDKIEVVLNEEYIHFISSLLSDEEQNKETSKWRNQMTKDLRFLLHLNKTK